MFTRFRLAVVGIVALALTVVGAGVGNAVVTSDQTVGYGGASLGISSTYWSSQTFTASMTGPLTKVDLTVLGPGDQLTVQIRSVDTSTPPRPSGTVLAAEAFTSTTLGSLAQSAQTFTVTFANPANVVKDGKYAIVLGSSTALAGTKITWLAKSSSTYARGDSFVSTDQGSTWAVQGPGGSYIDQTNVDFSFTTYVDADGLTSSALTLPIVAGHTRTVEITGNPALPDGTVVTASSSNSNAISVPASALASGGKAVFVVTGRSVGSADLTFSASSYADKVVSGQSTTYLSLCSATANEAPCLEHAKIGGLDYTPGTAASPTAPSVSLTAQGVQFSAPALNGKQTLSGFAGTDTVIDITANLGSSPPASSYFTTVIGHLDDVSVTTSGGKQYVRVQMKPVVHQTVPNGTGPTCTSASCAENLVATQETLAAFGTVIPVATASAGVEIPEEFGGGWVANNGQFLSLNSFADGDLNFTVGGPHFKVGCTPVDSPSTSVATQPGACAGC